LRDLKKVVCSAYNSTDRPSSCPWSQWSFWVFLAAVKNKIKILKRMTDPQVQDLLFVWFL
jgi:hypothetical protein